MEELQKQKRKTIILRIIEEILLLIIILVIVFIEPIGEWFDNLNCNKQYKEISVESQAINIFNSIFTSYTGKGIEGRIVRDLIRTVNNVNTSTVYNEEHKVLINGSNKIPKLSDYLLEKQYDIDLEYNEEGYVYNIIITEGE